MSASHRAARTAGPSGVLVWGRCDRGGALPQTAGARRRGGGCREVATDCWRQTCRLSAAAWWPAPRFRNCGEEQAVWIPNVLTSCPECRMTFELLPTRASAPTALQQLQRRAGCCLKRRSSGGKEGIRTSPVDEIRDACRPCRSPRNQPACWTLRPAHGWWLRPRRWIVRQLRHSRYRSAPLVQNRMLILTGACRSRRCGPGD